MPAEQGFNSFISLHTIGLSYHRNTQPAKFSAFGIIGPVPSVARAANPADTLTSIGECVLSIEVTEILKAAVLPVAQFVNRRSAGCMWLWLAVRSLPVSTWGHQDGHSGFNQNIMKDVVLYHNITHICTSGAMMSKRVKGNARAMCTLQSLGCVHTKPLSGNRID
eukprot:Em0012g253a